MKQKISLNILEELLLLLVRDENLSDLPQNLTSEYVDNLIKIEIGRAFNIYIVKFTGEKIRMFSVSFIFVSPFHKRTKNTEFYSGLQKSCPLSYIRTAFFYYLSTPKKTNFVFGMLAISPLDKLY